MMYKWLHNSRRAGRVLLLGALLISAQLHAQSNVTVRVMAANLTGNSQTYGDPEIRILQGLKPDVVCIQEFNYSNNSTADIRAMVDRAFGPDFVFYREPFTASGDLPNGVISRYPFVNTGYWPDTEVGNRGFAWAQIAVPGTNNLYVVSVHLLTSSSSARGLEAAHLKTLIQSNFPPGAWVIVAGDFNTDSRTESPAMPTFTSYLSDFPIPVDNLGNPDTSMNRNSPHDFVLPSFSLTNRLVATVYPSNTFPNGLVFDSRVYTPLTDVTPVLVGDSIGAQHMGVLKDFSIPVTGTGTSNAPSIATQPQSRTVALGANASFSVTANGTAPLAYQWRFYATNLAGATTSSFTRTNAQPADAGDYSVVVTNSYGSVTSSVATLTVSSGPVINTQPQSQSIFVGQSATFAVNAGGAPPLSYQWRFTGTNIGGATTNSYTRTNSQTNDAGNYDVVVTNLSGSVTSQWAALQVNQIQTGTLTTLAGWDVSVLSGYGASPLAPTTNAAGITVVGLTRGAGVGTSGTAATRAWGGNDFITASAATAISAGDFATFSIAASTGYKVSFSSISKFDYRRSSTGPTSGVLQYAIGAAAFTDIASLSYSAVGTAASLSPIDLTSIAPLQGIAASNIVTFRIVNYGGTSSGGTWYVFDTASNSAPDFVVQGIVASTATTNPPAQAPTLTGPAMSNGLFQFLVTGSAGSNYIVQVATNLSGSNWTSLLTNASPFTFIESNPAVVPQRFYRAMVAP